MDFSANNTALWNFIIQFGIISVVLLLSNVLRRKIPILQKSLVPTAVLGGFLLQLVRMTGIVQVDTEILEMITYHGIAIGFIALSLRTARLEQKANGNLDGAKSGALIVSCYVLQGIIGLLISVGLAYTLLPDLFKASGVLLPMGYGQGPGQANNIGSVYESLGFVGGRSFALSLAAAGFISACIVGVIYINYLNRKGRITRLPNETRASNEEIAVDVFQDDNEIPIARSVDRLSVQMALVLGVYLITYIVIGGLTSLSGMLGEGLGTTISTLLWGFNFIIGSVIAMLIRTAMKGLRQAKLMTRQYQNNYLLSRISGFFFDLMIVAGIASIDINVLDKLWLPFVLMSVFGAAATFMYLRYICRKIYPGYYFEGMISMFGMMTGTISSGVLLLREVDPQFKTKASTNLLTGSSFAVLIGAPMLLLTGIAPNSTRMTLVVLGILVVYFVLLWVFLIKANPRRNH